MKIFIPIFLFVALGGGSSLRAGSVSYQFVINTSALSGQSDNLDFQLVPGDVSSPYISLDISGFGLTGGSFVANQIQLTVDASGTLAGDVLLDNSLGYNDAYQPVQLGTSVTFVATFSGAGVDNPASPGTTFGFSIYDSTGMTALLTTSADGTIAGVNLDANGVVPFTNPAVAGGGSSATVSAATPEPSSVVSMLLGMGMILAAWRARRLTV